MNRLILLAAFLVATAVPKTAAAATPSFADFGKRAKAGESLSVVFFGSSLTWGVNASDPQLTSYRAIISQRLQQAYPKAHFKFWDAAIGGAGSQLGVFRLQRDVLPKKPDLVFIDFSANDDLTTAVPETLASFEAVVRQIINDGKAAVVIAILPFQLHVADGKPAQLKRLAAHLAIAKAYNTGVADAVAEVHKRLAAKKVTVGQLWPFDRIHPDDKGYALFADAVWDGFQKSVKEGKVCRIPPKMLYPDTYMKTARFSLAKLKSLPSGWSRGKPLRSAASFDMLMSRWLDDVVIAANKMTVPDGKGKTKVVDQNVDKLTMRFRGESVLLFGESTKQSGNYRIYLNGKVMDRGAGNGNGKPKAFDASWLADLMHGNSHLVHVLATGLEANKTHELVIEPIFPSKMVQQELRLESICIAGGEAKVLNETSK